MTDLNALESLYFAALEKPPAERPAFLDAACGGDADLRARVGRLLEAQPNVGAFLDAPAATADLPNAGKTATFGSDAGATADFPGKDERVGAVLGGKYKLVEEIGEGGMGSVYMAQQTEPVKRAVAVKVIKAGMDSKAVLARFEDERQALAMMDHPNIAKVLDAGTTESGRPYFVMELVKGDPITKYCDDRKLTPRQRLELFVPVCNAIQHAHMKGVIHRDIKPSNVLVAMYDDKPVPKVIDFGVAKAAGPALTDKTLMTGFGAVVGTPEYMSPEQASLNNLDIDTRSDVYSLGVLLYELLTGTTPVDRKSLGKAALLEVLRIVREVEAPRPSARLSTADAVASLSADRGTDPKKLTGLLRNELDWIVVKALEKDRTRRYESANGFAADVQRYLSGEAVQAHPPTAGYRLRKAYRRNRAAVWVMMAFVGLVCGAAVMGTVLTVQARRAEAVAEDKRIEAEANAKESEERSQSIANLQGVVSGQADRLRWELKNAELAASSFKVDLDLAEIKTDQRIGLLRLTQTLQETTRLVPPLFLGMDREDLIATHRALREFVTMAVLAIGQQYSPLLPPLTHEGREVIFSTNSPDGKKLLTLGEDGTARLWDSSTAKSVAILRKSNERIIRCDFGPDGKLIYTLDINSVLRFWQTDDGCFRAETGLQGERFQYPATDSVKRLMEAANYTCKIRIVDRYAVTQTQPVDLSNAGMTGSNDWLYSGKVLPAELWDLSTGRSIRKFQLPDKDLNHFVLSPKGRWLAAVENNGQGVIYSPETGNEIARLKLPRKETITSILFSPNERFVLMASYYTPDDHSSIWSVRLWHTDSWKPLAHQFPEGISSGPVFLSDDRIKVHDKIYSIGQPGLPTTIDATAVDRMGGELLICDNNRLIDGYTLKRLQSPEGRKYHHAFARLAFDGRFVFATRTHWPDYRNQFIDTVTEKHIELNNWHCPGDKPVFVPSVGYMAFHGPDRRVLPSAQLAIPPAMLELWAQVAVRGELGPEGEFVKWDEPTWEKKRQELAALPTPYPDFPFPGYVATDKLHWLRAEYEAAAEKDKLRLATDLLRRAEASGDKVEAVRWRAETDRLTPQIAPPPREKK